MYQFQKAQKKSLSKSLFLIVISLFLTLPHHVYSQDLDENSNFESFVLIGAQTVNAVAAHDQILTIGVASIGNTSLTARLQPPQTGVTGFWWLALMGTGGSQPFNVTFGIIPASSGISIFADPGFSLGLAIGGIILDSPETLEEPVEYEISVSGGGGVL